MTQPTTLEQTGDTRPSPVPDPDDDDASGPVALRRIGLLGGLGLFLLMRALPGPAALPPAGWATAAVAVLMGVLWLTEAAPISVTALLPLALFPVLGVATMAQAATPYANEVIRDFLFMGGFFLGKTIEKWALHRRIAIGIIARIGTSPSRLLLGMMAATAFISMWISNTATAAMMLPIALAVAEMFRPGVEGSTPGRPYNFGIALMLGIAYSSSIGGIGTLIGTPPNALFAASALEITGRRVGFLQWMLVGGPVTVIMISLTWQILLRVYPPDTAAMGDGGAVIAEQRRQMGPLSRPERFVGLVFAAMVLAWIMREPKVFGSVSVPGIATFLPGVTDGTIAIIGALVLFVVPLDWRTGGTALDWDTAVRIPWGVLLLFGGGLSLADAMNSSGLAVWIGGGVAALAGAPPIVLIAVTSAVFVFLGEFTSNTAMTAMAMPVMAAVAAPLRMSPLVLMGAVALACSMGCCLPAGTPPNAIVFGSGYLTIGQMVRAGIWVNLLGIAMATLAATFLLPLVFAS